MQTQTNQTAKTQTTTNEAYYMGRNSIGDEGQVWFKLSDCPEINTPELVEEFKRGVRHIRSEIQLNADTEWDGDDD